MMLKPISKIQLFESKYEPNSGGWLIDGKLDYGSVELEVGRLLNAIVLVHQPKTILETGTYFGYSTSCLASALMQLGGERVVYTIDCQANELLFSGSCFEKYINVILGKSQDVNKIFDKIWFEMLVLDSNHDYETVSSEIELYEPKLVEGGLILMHDSLFFDGVGAAVKELVKTGRFEHITLDTPRNHDGKTKRRPGISILRKIRSGNPVAKNKDFSGWFVGDPQGEPFLRCTRARIISP